MKNANKALKDSLRTTINRLSKVFSWNQHFSHLKNRDSVVKVITARLNKELVSRPLGWNANSFSCCYYVST